MRIEVLTSISGVEFADAFQKREPGNIEKIPVNLISLEHLKQNKAAAGRYKDLNDLEHLS